MWRGTTLSNETGLCVSRRECEADDLCRKLKRVYHGGFDDDVGRSGQAGMLAFVDDVSVVHY